VPLAFAFGQYLDGHPSRQGSAGAVVGLDAVLSGRWLPSGRYRFVYVSGRGLPGVGKIDLFQHEMYLTGGFSTTRWEALAHGGFVHTTQVKKGRGKGVAAWNPNVPMAGLSGRYTHWADFLLAGTWTMYDDGHWYQLDAGAVLPVWSRLAVAAGFEAQFAPKKVFPSGSVEVQWNDRRWSAAGGGFFGRRSRPVDLVSRSVYNLPDDVALGAHARAAVNASSRVGLYLEYEYERFATPPPVKGGPELQSDGHRGTLGMSLRAWP
jgi:hypothetical protein